MPTYNYCLNCEKTFEDWKKEECPYCQCENIIFSKDINEKLLSWVNNNSPVDPD